MRNPAYPQGSMSERLLHRWCRAGAASAWVLLIIFAPAPAWGTDILGGTPAASDIDFFQRTNNPARGTWRVRLSSLVYQHDNVVPPGLESFAPATGQSLFVYLLENIGNGVDSLNPWASDSAVPSFTVANPDVPGLGAAAIIAVDRANSVIPDPLSLLVSGPRHDPAAYHINPLNVDYDWQVLPNPPQDLLNVNDYSIVYFLAEGGYTQQPALLMGAAQGNVQMVLGPLAVPEPAMLALLLFTAAFITSSRRRGGRG